MGALFGASTIRRVIDANRGMGQRYLALFFVSLFWLSILIGPASVVHAAAIEQLQSDQLQLATDESATIHTGANPESPAAAESHKDKLVKPIQEQTGKPMKQDYAGPLAEQKSKTKPAADYAGATDNASAGGILDSFNTNAITSISNEGTQSAPQTKKQAYKEEELLDKRTADAATFRKKDGSLIVKKYSAPKFFKKSGKWTPISTKLVEDKNAGDSGNVFGKVLGNAQSWVTSTDTYTIEENDWHARFAPSDAEQGMVRIKQGDSQIAFNPVGAKQVKPVITTESNGNQTVHYYNLWPGVDVEYAVLSAELKENIILKNKNATRDFAFKIEGAQLQKSKDSSKTGLLYDIKGALGDDFAIAPLAVILDKYGIESQQQPLTQSFEDGQLKIGISNEYLKGLPKDAYPVTIDPTTINRNGFGTRAGGNYGSVKSDGYYCNSSICNPLAGSVLDQYGVWRSWRGFIFPDYSVTKGRQLNSATLHLTQRLGLNTSGTTANKNFKAWAAPCIGWNCLGVGSGVVNIGTVGDIDVTSIYQNRMTAGDYNSGLAITGEETNSTTYKNWDPDNSWVEFNVTDVIPAPSVTYPHEGQVFIDPQVAFTSTTAVNPTSGNQLKYIFCVSTSPSCVGAVMMSSPQASSQWTIPDGLLQDGTTYYITMQGFDQVSGVDIYSSYGVPVSFKIDSRSGKDTTQAFDTLGPVSVDLATGNMTTSSSSHSSSALGGSLGISLDYNSPMRSRSGLVGTYYNSEDLSGSAALTRVDPQVDFNWIDGSPAAGTVNVDHFSARWEGYFVAPKTGSYQFGSQTDDGCRIWVNDVLILDVWTNCSPQYGATAFNLAAGQPAKIKVEFREIGGVASTRLMVKGVVSSTGMTIPNAWLQTGIRNVSQDNGLIGRYYKDDAATHDFASAQLIMQRTDPSISFSWGQGPAVPGGPNDNYMVRWTGYVTVPVAGSYDFGTLADDGARMTVGTTQIVNHWVDDGSGVTQWGTASLAANTPTAVTVDFYEHGGAANMALKVKSSSLGISEQVVPSSWLTSRAVTLPAGWNMGIDPDGNVSYDRLKVAANSVILTDSTGSTHEYTWDTTKNNYKPPVNEDGQLVRNADATFTFQDTDGRTYVFNADGTIASLTSPVDDAKPAALQYTYSGTPSRLTQITDGVTTARWAKVYYSGDSNCGTAPSGFDTSAPTGMLCAVKTDDGRATYYFYKSGKLARTTEPGNEITDYGYDNFGRITSVRDPLANDAVAAGVRADDITVNTEIEYDDMGRVKQVKQPAATAGATRTAHTVDYKPGDTYGLLGNYYMLGSSDALAIPTDGRVPLGQLDRDINFEWQLGPGVAGYQTDRFAVRWTGYITAPKEADYQFCARTDDGVSMTLDGASYISSWIDKGPDPAVCGSTIHLTKGQSKAIVMDYYENGGSATAKLQVAYDGQPSQPVPYNWLTPVAPVAGNYFGATEQHVVGATEPNGYTHRVEYDNLLRTIRDIDIAGLADTTEWDPYKDLTYSTTDETGLKSTTIYDDEDRAVTQYGPVPAAWYGTDRKPTSTYVSQVPRTDTAFDENMQGPSVTYYSYSAASKSLTGAPKLHTTNLSGAVAGDFSKSYTSTSPITGVTDNWGFRATGRMRLPTTGQWKFRMVSDGGAKLYIDDKVMTDDWNDGTSRSHPEELVDNVAGSVYRFRIEYYHTTGTADFTLYLTPPGGTETAVGINQYLSPDYSLTTSTKTYDATLGDSVTKTNYGSNPELGLAQSTSVDPTGLNLTTTSTYETQGATGSFLRQTAKYLPGANTAVASTATQYSYYTATDTKDNPCTTGTTEAYRQGGMLKLKTEADPDGTGTKTSRTTETIYDDAGRVVATRYNSDSWTCTTYDTRGRVTTTVIPAFNGSAARTISNDYAVGGSPLVTTTWDAQGWIVTWSDLLGRNTKYRDVHDDETTSTYDNYGKLAQRVSPLGTEVYIYDNYSRLTEQKLDGVTLATVTYDSYGRIDKVDYNNANSMRVTLGRDTLGRTNSLTYRMGDGTTTVSDTVTRTQSNQITTDVVASGSSDLWYTYGYDNADRITSASIGPNSYSYGYGAQDTTTCGTGGATNADSGKNGNRTTQTINGTTTKFCYDYADRLTGSSNALWNGGDLDSHGNMTSVGTGTTPLRLCFDSSDRNTCMTQRDSSGNGIAMYYNRDVQGRIVARFKNTLTNWTAAAAGDYYYGFTGSGDTPDYVRDVNWNVSEKNIELPGGVVVTIKPLVSGNGNKNYNLPNIHGDTLLTANAAGTNTSNGNGPLNSFTYDPFGNVLSGSVLPANADNASYGYVGQHEKLTESDFTLTPIQMGTRVYIPAIGRFLQVDSIEGGGDNNYSYPTDPVNEFDLDGNSWYSPKSIVKAVTRAANVASFVPGPIGMAGSAVAAAGYASQGRWGLAAASAAGFVPGGRLVGGIANKSKLGTRLLTKTMNAQAKMKGVGAQSKLFGIKAKLNNGRYRMGWSNGKNGKLNFRIGKPGSHNSLFGYKFNTSYKFLNVMKGKYR